MKILVTEPEFFPSELLKSLESFGTVLAKRMSRDEFVNEIADSEVIIIRVDTKVDKYLLDRAKKLKAIVSVTTGLDHIDLEEAKKRGVKVLNPPGYATNAVVEYTVSLILSLARKVPWSYNYLKNGGWDRHKFMGNEIFGKTLGVIGFGRIGREVAKRAQSFGMKIIFFDPYIEASSVKDVMAEKVSLEEIFSKSDFITVHAVLTKETENMISLNELKKMKKTAMLVNTSRGQLINENDLAFALKNGIIAGAAMDVFHKEPLSSENVLVKYASDNNNLLITPHIGGSTKEAIENANSFIVESIRSLQNAKV